jgi:hypothetical protein
LVRHGQVGDDSGVPEEHANITHGDGADDVARLRAALAAAEARIVALEQIIHDLRRARFGQSAERVDPGQLALALSGAPPPPPANNDNKPPRSHKPSGAATVAACRPISSASSRCWTSPTAAARAAAGRCGG